MITLNKLYMINEFLVEQFGGLGVGYNLEVYT